MPEGSNSGTHDPGAPYTGREGLKVPKTQGHSWRAGLRWGPTPGLSHQVTWQLQ